MVICAINVSEGRRDGILAGLAADAGADLLDVHSDADHNRAVLTVLGEEAPRAVAAAAVELVDLRRHTGAHPRFGAVDVVPFAPVGSAGLDEAAGARNRFAAWITAALGVPSFVYGPDTMSLPELRRGLPGLCPTHGHPLPHPTAGAVAVGVRYPLVAYNLWLAEPDLSVARAVAASLRGPAVRALGLRVGDEVQVSCNLVDPLVVGPAAVHDAVAAQAPIGRAELVGLMPRAVLDQIPPERWASLDLALDRTVEARIAAR